MGLLSPPRDHGDEPRRPNGEPVSQPVSTRNEAEIDRVDWSLVNSSVRSKTYVERGLDGFLDLAIERRVQDRLLDERLVAMGPESGWPPLP